MLLFCATGRTPARLRFNARMTPIRANIVGPPSVATSIKGFDCGLPFRGE
jgi:hypothetical protein